MFSPSSTETLPSVHKPRMLVVCFDGTTNKYGPENTNVVKLFAMLRKDLEDEQLCYYQTGIGTYGPPRFWSPVTKVIAKLADEAIAWYLDAHVMGGYSFLMDNYRNGDKISIFGFSRGAYTARALAGMLTKVGLLPKDNTEQVPFAWQWYTKTDATSLIQAEGFKKVFARSVEIDFLGVWETVASTGVIMSRNLPFTTNNRKIKKFRHALALDEHRAKFVPTFWHIPVGSSAPANGQATQTQSSDKQDAALLEAAEKAPTRSNLLSFFARSASQSSAEIRSIADPQEDDTNACDVKEVWFVGGHSDVGGGAVTNDTAASLADITLRWMIREIVSSKCGIQLDASAMEKFNVHVLIPPEQHFSVSLAAANATTSPPQAKSSAEQPQPSEQDEASDNVDALKPLHDDLVLLPLCIFWWILEVIPLIFSWQDRLGIWHKKWELHMGRGRYINDTDPMLFHETVRVRMNDTALKYKPKLKYTPGTEKYVW